MVNKNPRNGICHECLDKFPYKKLNDFHVESKYGPDHIVLLCSPCKEIKDAIVNNTPRKKTRSRVPR